MSRATWFQRARRRIADWIDPPPVVVLRPKRIKPTKAKSHWSGEMSGTEAAILEQLAVREMTRLELAEATCTTTTGQILPHMVRRGQVVIVPGTRPYRYRLAVKETS